MAENLARSQLEYIKSQAYQPLPGASYAIVTPPPPAVDYTVGVTPEAVDGGDVNIEKIVVVVTRDGKEIFRVEDYRVNR